MPATGRLGPASRLWPGSAVPLLITTLFAVTACESPQQVIAERENNLAAAGFELRPANSPERQDMIKRLPLQQVLQRVRGDKVTYVYADPIVCNCLYVGTQQAYGRYQAYLQQKKLADQQQATAQMWSDAGWDWGAWGPWGPGYGFGPGPGW